MGGRNETQAAQRPSRRARRAGLALLACAAALAACGRDGGSGPAAGEAARDFFPLVEGATWVYELRSEMGNLEVEVTARGSMALPGDKGRLFVMEERNLGPDLGFVETAPVGYLVKDGYVSRVTALDFDDKGALRMLGAEEPTWFLPVDPKPGHLWTQSTKLFEMPEGGGARFRWSGTVGAATRVSVPAGEFADVTEVETRYEDLSEESGVPKVVYHDFYARGIGLVRSVTEDPSGDKSHTIEQVLRSYRFPD